MTNFSYQFLLRDNDDECGDESDDDSLTHVERFRHCSKLILTLTLTNILPKISFFL